MIIISGLTSVTAHIKELFNATGLPAEYVMILFKAIGICLLTEIASDTCRDAGETALATKTEIAGKVLVLTASLPLFDEIITTALGLIKG